MTKIISYKGFDKNLQCRGFQYEIGKTYTHDGEAVACKSGFHACENPIDVFNYYRPINSRFALVEQSGTISKERSDSKVASSTITILKELTLEELLAACVEYVKQHGAGGAHETYDYSVASNTGDYSVATNTGDYSVATNTGYRSVATNTGDYSVATNTGYRSVATNTRNRSVAANTGDRSVASNAGDYSVATNIGEQSVATNTGNYSVASNIGEQSVATNSGDWSVVRVTGKQSVAVAVGYESKALAVEGSAIVIVHRNDVGDIICGRFSLVGENGIKPNVYYTLDAEGNFVEAE